MSHETLHHRARRDGTAASARRSRPARSAPFTSWPMNRTRPSTSARVSGLATSWRSAASFTAARPVSAVAQVLVEPRRQLRAPRARAPGAAREQPVGRLHRAQRVLPDVEVVRAAAGRSRRIGSLSGRSARERRHARRAGAAPRAAARSAEDARPARRASARRRRRVTPGPPPAAAATTAPSRRQPGRRASRAARSTRTGSAASASGAQRRTRPAREIGEPAGRVDDGRAAVARRARARGTASALTVKSRAREIGLDGGRAEVRDVHRDRPPTSRQTPRRARRGRRRRRRGARRGRGRARARPPAPRRRAPAAARRRRRRARRRRPATAGAAGLSAAARLPMTARASAGKRWRSSAVLTARSAPSAPTSRPPPRRDAPSRRARAARARPRRRRTGTPKSRASRRGVE